MAVIAVRI